MEKLKYLVQNRNFLQLSLSNRDFKLLINYQYTRILNQLIFNRFWLALSRSHAYKFFQMHMSPSLIVKTYKLYQNSNHLTSSEIMSVEK